jgi:steroid delta-isomerase-like uncharacterized protein
MGPVLKFVVIVAISAACGTTSRSAAPATAEPELAEVDDQVESNRRVMVRFTEFINTASETLANELISPDAIFFVPGRSEPMRGPAGYLAIIGMMRGGFPDIQWTLEETIAEGDKVAARFTMRGTHRGTFLGVPPTGKPIVVQAMNIYRLSGGQFIEERGQPDMLALLQQIGAAPAP